MMRTQSKGMFYKLLNFADSSAIGLAFTEEYGKLKFFINKAFTKKGSIYKIIPGEIDFLKKDNTDLNKFYSFKEDLTYYYFLEYIPLYLRLYLIFEIIDTLYDLEERDSYLFKLLLHAKESNMQKFSVYTVFYMLRKNGINFSTDICDNCAHIFKEEAYLTTSGLYCNNCISSGYIKILNMEDLYLFKTINDPDAFRSFNIDEAIELHMLEIIVGYIEEYTNKKIKSFDNLRVLQ
jgi:DNA repair protein RecO (recombination protein O)